MLLPDFVHPSRFSEQSGADDCRTIAILIVEKAGRRPLMLWMGLAQGLTMAVLAGLYNTVDAGNKAAQGVSVLMLFLFNTWFSIGWLGMTWLYPAEITPLRIRAVSRCSIATLSVSPEDLLITLSPPTGYPLLRIGFSTSSVSM